MMVANNSFILFSRVVAMQSSTVRSIIDIYISFINFGSIYELTTLRALCSELLNG